MVNSNLDMFAPKKTLKTFWLSSLNMTVGVDVDDSGIIVEAAPVVRKFEGQPLSNLVKWLSRQPGFKWVQVLPEERK